MKDLTRIKWSLQQHSDKNSATQTKIRDEARRFEEKFGALEQRRALVVGGSGYIGTVINQHLLWSGYKVRNLDLCLYQNHLCSVVPSAFENYEFVHGDLAKKETVYSALKDVTDVVILAGLVGDPITKKYPEASHKINHEGLLNFLKHLKDFSINKVVFASTCSNYGLIPENDMADENYALSPLSLYAQAKVAIEQELLSGNYSKYFSPTVLRFATAFGLSPRMRFDLTVNEFARELFLQKELLVFDADTWRPYCHVRDFAVVIRHILEWPIQQVANEVFNVGSNKNNHTKRMVVEELQKHFPQARVMYKEHGADPRNYRVSFEKLAKTIQYVPQVSVSLGLTEILSALKNHVFDQVETNKNLFGNYELEYS